MVRDADTGQRSAGGNGSWCPELESRTTPPAKTGRRVGSVLLGVNQVGHGLQQLQPVWIIPTAAVSELVA